MMESVQPTRFLPDWLAQQAFRRPLQRALESPDGNLTYEELFDAACRHAASLYDDGIRAQDRVAVAVKSGYTYALFLHALMQLNAVVVPLNWRLTGAELAQQVEDAGATCIVFDEACNDLVRDITPRLSFAVKTLQTEEMRNTITEKRCIREVVDLVAPHALIYTSGTTGKPKGAILRYQNHLWSAMASAMQLGVLPEDRWLVPMPLFHVGGMAVLIRSLIYGTTVVIHNGFSEEAVNRALDEENVSLVSVVPAMLQRMLESRTTGYPKTLRAVLLGGSAAPKSLLERAHALQVPINQSYGMTETNTQATTLLSVDSLRKVGSSGKPLFNTEVAIQTTRGRSTKPYEEGEILVKGPTVISGYYNRPDANKASFVDGWFYTGDIGMKDEEGYLYVLDRRSDLIVSGGENVYPAEVESVLMGHPAVLEVAVVARDDAKWGQVPVAFVVPYGEKYPSAAELLEYCKSRLAGYKVPKDIVMTDTLPRNASGKLLRRLLREQVKG